eukprot:scaffold128813_cov63-Phaeocystis_antarctica.AAC.2
MAVAGLATAAVATAAVGLATAAVGLATEGRWRCIWRKLCTCKISDGVGNTVHSRILDCRDPPGTLCCAHCAHRRGSNGLMCQV